MHRVVKRAMVAGLLIVLAAPLGAVRGADDDWEVKWSNGFKVESADEKFKLEFGGRLQADWTFVDPDDGLEAFLGEPLNDGNEFRRARLFVSGTIYERVEFKVQYDFAGGDADFKDAYVGFKGTPIGNIRIGHFKEPFSLEELTSSKYLAFLERSLPNVFSPGRNTGVMLHDNRGDRMTWAVGAFREADDFGETGNGEGKLNLTARVTGLPVYEDDGKKLVHVGLSLTDKDLGDDTWRFRSRPEAHQTERFVDTSAFAADGFMVYDLEFAAVIKRFWAAAEYMMAEGDASALGDPGFSSAYAQVGYFLTDDYRRYKTSAAAFDRQKPGSNFGEGKGAWEIALRYSTLDLTDAGVTGGELDDLGVALNWYPNPATRVMFNYINADRSDIGEGQADFFLVRLQVDF